MAKVHGITYDDLGRLGVDDESRLYWDGKPVVTEEKLTLAWWVNVAVVVGAVSTFVLAAIEVLRYLKTG